MRVEYLALGDICQRIGSPRSVWGDGVSPYWMPIDLICRRLPIGSWLIQYSAMDNLIPVLLAEGFGELVPR